MTKKSGTQAVHTTTLTTVEKATKGTPADITVGRRVLLTLNGNDVIVLPAGSKLGRLGLQRHDGFVHGREAERCARCADQDEQREGRRARSHPAKLTDIKSGTLVLAGGRASGKSVVQRDRGDRAAGRKCVRRLSISWSLTTRGA